MTIKQLIEILQRIDAPDAEVNIGYDVGSWNPCKSVERTWNAAGEVECVVVY